MDNQPYAMQDHGLENILRRIKPANYIPFEYNLKEMHEDSY